MTSQVLRTGVNLKYEATDQGAFVFALQSAWRASTQHSMFTSFKTSNQAKNSPSVQCRNASFNSAVAPFVRRQSESFFSTLPLRESRNRKKHNWRSPNVWRTMKKAFRVIIEAKIIFYSSSKQHFLKKGSELNIKNIFSSSSNAIDGMKHSACFLFSI